MNELTYLNAIILGIVQGLTEFLPISSSGHLALLQRFMDLAPDTRAMIMFDLAVHLGTLVAVAAVFQRQIRRFARSLVREFLNPRRQRPAALLIAMLGVVASVPTAIIGLYFKDTLEAAFDKPVWIASGLLLTGVLLWMTNHVPRPRIGWGRFGWWRALLIGTGQGIAILPGVSRSGTTIALALLAGVKRKWAGEFSFFIAAPAICGATLLHAREMMASANDAAGELPIGPLFVGTLFATMTGYAALLVLLVVVRRAKLHYFSYYCWVAGIVVLLVLRNGP